MSDRIAAVDSVNGVLKAFRKGIVLTQRISKVARSASLPNGRQTLDLAQALEKSLAESETYIDAAYSQGITAMGNKYADTIANDHVVTNKFQGLTINLLDQVMGLGDYMDAPEDFDVLSLQRIQKESEQARKQTLEVLYAVHQKLFTPVFGQYEIQSRKNSERTPSSTEAPRPISGVSSTTSAAIYHPYSPESRLVGKSTTYTASDSLDSRVATNTQRGFSTTSDPLQRPVNDDRWRLPSQIGQFTVRPASQISPVDLSTPSLISAPLPTSRHFTEKTPVQNLSTNAFARSLSAQSPQDDPQALNAYKSMILPAITDEQQSTKHSASPQHAMLDNRMELNRQSQKITDANPRIGISDKPMSETPNSFPSPAGYGEQLRTWDSHPESYQVNIPTGTSYATYKGEIQPLSLKPEQSRNVEEDFSLKLIDRESVERQMASNKNFLEKRRASKTSFRHDMENILQSTNSICPLPEPAYQTLPTPLATPEFSLGLAQIAQPGSTQFSTSISPQGQNFAHSKTPSPRTSAVLPKEPTFSSKPNDIEQFQPLGSPATVDNSKLMSGDLKPSMLHSISSEQTVRGMPDSPPLTLHSGRQSAAEDWGSLGKTLEAPRLGKSFDDGKEVIGQLTSDPGLMLACEADTIKLPSPAVSVHLVEHPLRHDSSFFQYGGFCESAKRLVRGDEGALKVIKKPGGGGILNISKKCVNCAYEMDFNVWERDQARDPAGIYTIGAINFRQKFLSKCHVATKHTDEPAYACIFCVEEGKTVDEYDATVFFSVSHFFRHLRKHTRPLKQVEGLAVVYGDNPNSVDFDIHFKTMEPVPSLFGEIRSKILSRPKAHAIVNHRPKARGFKEVDPDKVATLRFAQGARIVGITYPIRLNGAWCCGYHDEEKAHFPVSAVVLEPPSKEEYTTHANSALYATARWDHKPKDTSAGWLSFSKKEKITNIGFKYQDAWCWTGQNAKGKWGFFPACFVDGLCDGGGEKNPRPGALPRQATGDSSKHHSGSSFSLNRLSVRPFQRRSTSDSRTSGGASIHSSSPV